MATVDSSTRMNFGLDRSGSVAACAGRTARAGVRRWRAGWSGVPGPRQWVGTPVRMLVFAWLVGLMIAGNAAASADIIVAPDLAGGGQKTLFETYSFLDYKLTIEPSNSSEEGMLELEAMMYQMVGVINNILLWIILGVVYGGLVLLEWFLGLTLYRDSATEIDQAVQMIANHVFWPLIAVTAAVGAFMAYARWRGDGRGFGSDLMWVVAAAAIGAGFAAGPSTIMYPVDQARQEIGSGMIAGAASFVHDEGNPTGFPDPTIPADSQAAGVRTLVNSLWSTYGATPWCYAEFRKLSICEQAGHHMLANDQWWQDKMKTLKENGNPPVFSKWTDYVRGEDLTRTAVLLLMLGLALPLGLMLVWLVVKGLVAVVGLLLMLVLGLVFLTFWCIDGWFRQTGIKYWTYTLGLALQTLFITVVISGVMVVSSIIASQVGQYGFFLVAVFNIALFWAAVKARAWLEMMTSVGGAGTMGYGSVMAARSITKMVTKMVSGGAGVAAGAAGAASSGAASAGRRAMHGKPTPQGWTRVSPHGGGPASAGLYSRVVGGQHYSGKGRGGPPALATSGGNRPPGPSAPTPTRPGSGQGERGGGHTPAGAGAGGQRSARQARADQLSQQVRSFPRQGQQDAPRPATERGGVHNITSAAAPQQSGQAPHQSGQSGQSAQQPPRRRWPWRRGGDQR